MKKSLATAVLLITFLAQTEVSASEYGGFTLQTDETNAYLPVSLRFRAHPELELLHPTLALNHFFTTFEFRNKYYLEENRHVWGERDDPRFRVDVAPDVSAPAPAVEGDFQGEAFTYASSYATITRQLLFHRSEPRFRIVYGIEPTREMMIHMSGMFGVGLRLEESFTVREILDERNPDGEPLKGEGASYSVRLYNSGPVAFTAPEETVSILVSATLSRPFADRLIRLQPGEAFSITLDAEIFHNDREALLAMMRSRRDEMSPEDAPYRLFVTGMNILGRQDEEKGEAILREVADLKPEFYEPYMHIAEYRLRNGIDGVVRGISRGEAYHEAAFRMPYNYGIILRGGDYLHDERLTGDQHRLLFFNLMAALENTLFYPTYYRSLSAAFNRRDLDTIACAILRQALWAVDNYPVSESRREQRRSQISNGIETLAKRLLEEPPPVAATPVEIPAIKDRNDPAERLDLLETIFILEEVRFDPISYRELAGTLESIGLLSVANAIHRQILWALENIEVSEDRRVERGEIEEDIARLEARLLGDLTADPPAPIPVRPLDEATAQ